MDLFHGLLRTISVGISDNPVVNMWQWHHNHLIGSYMKSYLNITDLPKDGCHITTFDSWWNRRQIEGPLFSVWQFGLYVRIPRISYWIMTTVTIFFIETTGLTFGTMALRLRPVWRQSWQMEPLLAVSCRLSPSRAPVPPCPSPNGPQGLHLSPVNPLSPALASMRTHKQCMPPNFQRWLGRYVG